MIRLRTDKMMICALFAALTAILSQIAIPIGPIPINLATFAVFIAGALLGPRMGTVSLGVWALLGAAGAPVFSLFRGGLTALFGPTGGYIIGYIPAAFLIGLIVELFNKENKIYIYPMAMFVGLITYFWLGTLWYMHLMDASLVEALGICVIPYLPGDFLKIGAATVLVHRLKPVLRLQTA